MDIHEALEKMKAYNPKEHWSLTKTKCYKPKKCSHCLVSHHPNTCQGGREVCEICSILPVPGIGGCALVEAQADTWEEAVKIVLSRPKPKMMRRAKKKE